MQTLRSLVRGLAMSRWLCCLILGTSVAWLTGNVSHAGNGCGCEKVCYDCCRHHHRRHCCECEEKEERSVRRAPPAAPRAAIVESMPVFQLTPGIVTMPMVLNARAASFEAPRSREESCASSSDRLDLLELKVESLHVRLQTIQRSVEIQTRILEEMKAEGKFPRRYVEGDSAND